jgi:hypothetical protein
MAHLHFQLRSGGSHMFAGGAEAASLLLGLTASRSLVCVVERHLGFLMSAGGSCHTTGTRTYFTPPGMTPRAPSSFGLLGLSSDFIPVSLSGMDLAQIVSMHLNIDWTARELEGVLNHNRELEAIGASCKIQAVRPWRVEIRDQEAFLSAGAVFALSLAEQQITRHVEEVKFSLGDHCLGAGKITLSLVDVQSATLAQPQDAAADMLIRHWILERPLFYAAADQLVAPFLARHGEIRVNQGKVSLFFRSNVHSSRGTAATLSVSGESLFSSSKSGLRAVQSLTAGEATRPPLVPSVRAERESKVAQLP